MALHADYCPITIGVEVLGDRWTPLVIRELMVGASGFNEIHQGIPGSGAVRHYPSEA
jgi:DNA-binding HxlR family transcriptional regulator